MADSEKLNIAIAPNSIFSEELARKLAVLLGGDLYYARSILTSKIPRIIFRQKDNQEIEEIQKQLKEIGLVSFYFKESDIQKPLQLFKANSLEFIDSSCLFKDKNSQSLRLENNKVFLILTGNLKIYGDKEITTNIKKINITATLLMGGIPIRRNIQEKRTETTIENYCFLRLFDNNSMDFCLEVQQHSFNYSCLGKEMSSSSKQNFSLIARKLKDFFSEAVFIDSLNEFPSINASANPFYASFDVNCKLIYMYYLLIKSPRQA
jgi:hypothetical protein